MLRELSELQSKDVELYKWALSKPYVTAIFLAEFRDGSPHLSTRAFKFGPGNNPSIEVTAYDHYDEIGLSYSVQAKDRDQEYRMMLGTIPDKLQATRQIIEREIADFPQDVGPPIISVVLDKDGAHWTPPDADCPEIHASRTSSENR